MADFDNDEGREVSATGGVLATLNSSEIEQQVATAHKFPRSVKRFRDEALEMATLNEVIAGECVYAIPRDGKVIEGPSARFAEIVISAWGNSRCGARVIDDVGDFVTAQGAFHDLQRNVAIAYEVRRRITDKNGRRFSLDMIGVTGNAACAIALRNAVLKGVPKAFWGDIFDAARKTIMGDHKTLASRRAHALGALAKFGASAQMITGLLGVAGVEDITIEHLVTLHGIGVALRDGETTVEQAFAPPQGNGSLSDKLRKKEEPKPARAARAKKDKPPADPPAQGDAPPPVGEGKGPTLDEVKTMLRKASSQEIRDQIIDLARTLPSEDDKKAAAALYDELSKESGNG